MALACGLCALHCGGDPAPGPSEQEELERLRALGYVGFTDREVVPGEAAVTHHDAERSAPGYNLISNRDLATAQLFDAAGKVLRTWADPDAINWSHADLLPDGDLLVTGSEQVDPTGSNFLLRMSWDGRVVWRRSITAHHDAELTPMGNIATLTFDFRPIPEVSDRHEVKDHRITLLSQAGELLEEHSLYDLLCTRPDLFTCRPVTPKTQGTVTFIDLLHPNSIEFMRHAHLAERDPIYAPTNVLVSLRAQDVVAIFDWSRKRLVWAWGPGEISAQHDATVLPNGNILLFDNGLVAKRSRVVELDPLRKEIVWQYQAPDPEQFFSLRKGSSQRLPGGNTLIANSDHGEAFEVTRAGDVVWHFRNPNSDERGRRATIVRIHRYPEPFIQGLLDAERGTR